MRNYIGRFRIGFHQSETMAISFLDKYNVSAVAIRHLEKKINSRFVGVSGTFTRYYRSWKRRRPGIPRHVRFMHPSSLSLCQYIDMKLVCGHVRKVSELYWWTNEIFVENVTIRLT